MTNYPSAAGTSPQRILALDIMRGFTIAGMLLVNDPGSWEHIFSPLRHAEWNGLTPTDLVFPFFMFIMGVSTFLSLSKLRFEPSRKVIVKVVRRTVVIFFIGLAIGWFSRFCHYWNHAPSGLTFFRQLWEASWTFDVQRIPGVLQRLAVCYCIVAILSLTVSHRRFPVIIAVLLAAYTLLLFLGNGFEYGNGNILAIVDTGVFTLAHTYNDHGIDPEGLLSTIPSIAHVLLGFCVGERLFSTTVRTEDIWQRTGRLYFLGTMLTLAGWLLSYGCPVNKKIWSPTFVLITCGMATLLLASLILMADVWKKQRWSSFFVDFGVNPLALYTFGALLSILLDSIHISAFSISCSLHAWIYTHGLCAVLDPTAASLAYALLFVALCWLPAHWLRSHNLFIKI